MATYNVQRSTYITIESISTELYDTIYIRYVEMRLLIIDHRIHPKPSTHLIFEIPSRKDILADYNSVGGPENLYLDRLGQVSLWLVSKTKACIQPACMPSAFGSFSVSTRHDIEIT